jgi:hypothetical protein
MCRTLTDGGPSKAPGSGRQRRRAASRQHGLAPATGLSQTLDSWLFQTSQERVFMPSASPIHRPLLALAALAGAAGWGGQALAWGDTGHRMIGELAIQALPPMIPAFLRAPEAARDVGELAREPDRSRGAGRTHDTDRDAGHFVDGDDEGKILGGPPLGHVPLTRAEYETQLRAVGADSWKAGYLPYSIIEGWQQLVKDFAYWRADAAGERLASDPAHKAWLAADRARRERQVINDLGVWAHYVGDASQPLHTTVHYNGWGPGPNPNGYTLEHIHVPLEAAYVTKNVTAQAVRGRMRPYVNCGCRIDEATGAYLVAESQTMIPLYELEKSGGFKDGDPRGVAFMTDRIAEGASELRDLVIAAWNASGAMTVGYPGVAALDVEAGKAGDAYELLYGGQ